MVAMANKMKSAFLLFGTLCILLLAACKNDKTETDDASHSVIEMLTEEQTQSVSGSEQNLPASSMTGYEATPSSTGSGNNSTHHITWAVCIAPFITEEAREEIRQHLQSKGIDCQIDFVQEALATDFPDWLDQQKNKGSVPDIIPSLGWKNGVYGAAKFIEKEFLPMNDFLTTDEGKELQENYGEPEWGQTTLNGKIYTVPARPIHEQYGVYIYINNRFRSVFDEVFDGTYASLRELAMSLHTDSPVFAYKGFDTDIALGLLGYREVLYATYDLNKGKFADVSKQKELKTLLLEMYADIESGLFNEFLSPEQISEEIDVYISSSRLNKIPDNFSEYVLVPPGTSANYAMSYGVCAMSDQKDLALQVLSACFSDPKIASLICWREDMSEEWMRWTSYYNSLEANGITGFLPNLTEEEIESLRSFSKDLTELAHYDVNASGIATLRRDFREAVDSFFKNLSDYSALYDKINQQLEAWTKDHDY